MGKATQMADDLDARPLSSAEIMARRAAMAISDDDVEVTLEGRLVKRPRLSEKSSEVLKAPQQTWE
jgi:hypothetical protein